MNSVGSTELNDVFCFISVWKKNIFLLELVSVLIFRSSIISLNTPLFIRGLFSSGNYSLVILRCCK